MSASDLADRPAVPADAAAARARRETRSVLTVVGVMALTAVAGLLLTIVFGDGDQRRKNEPTGVQTFAYENQDHVNGAVAYAESPPVGGPHAPAWQNCGFYGVAIQPEQGVHALEHGAVWIAYAPGLPADQTARLREIADRNDYVLVSAYPGLAAPIVASSWNHQQSFAAPDDTALTAFLYAFLKGPETPEPGASCSGGSSAPAA